MMTVGCAKEGSKEPSSTVAADVIDKETGRIPLSKLIDWKHEKINGALGSWGQSSLVENDRYIYYATTNREIVRSDRKNGERKVILNLKKLNMMMMELF